MKLVRLAGMLVVTALFLVVMEVASIAGERIAYGARWTGGGPVGLYVPGMGRPVLAPGAQLNGWLYQVSINDMGFRGPAPEREKPPRGLRVWCVGGSTTFDIYAPDDASTWPSRLQAELRERAPDRPIEVFNGGVPGATLTDSLNDFRQMDPRLDLDVLVLHHGPNDLRDVVVGMAPPASGFVLKMQRLALIRVLQRVRPAPSPRPEWASNRLRENQLARVRSRVVALLDEADRRDVSVVLATHAHRADDEATGATARRQVAEGVNLYAMEPEAVIDMFARYNDMIRALAAERGLPLADVRAGVSTDPANWGDATHFAAPGSMMAARVVGETIERGGLLEEASR